MKKICVVGVTHMWMLSRAVPLFIGLLSVLPARGAASYGDLPLRFEPNRGQANSRVQFLARSRAMSVLLGEGEATLIFHPEGHEAVESAVVRMRLLNARKPKAVEGVDQSSAIANYFHGTDSRKWRTNIPLYGKVRYDEVYQGVDLVYYGNQGRLEFDFEVAPDTDPKSILLELQGAERLSLDGSGELVAHTEAGELRLKKPVAYQVAAGRRRQVEAHFTLLAGNRLSFALGSYDRTLPMVIDPVLVYSTFLGSTGDESSQAIAVDSAGSAYITGYTLSAYFPAVGGTANMHPSYDYYAEVFIVKLNPAGTDVVYSTCIGGSGDDQGHSIVVDNSGNAYVAGTADWADFPLVSPVPVQSGKGFLLKLNPEGNTVLYCIPSAGPHVAVDKRNGSAYTAGRTSSAGFVTTTGAYQSAFGGQSDGLVGKVDPGGVPLFLTYLGGAGYDSIEGIAVDGDGNPIVTGYTESTGFPTTTGVVKRSLSGVRDAFVTKLSSDGSTLVYSTYLGGSGEDLAYGIAVDSAGSAYVTGYTLSADLPTTPGVVQPTPGGSGGQGFALKLSLDATSLVYSTYLGGARPSQGNSIAVAADGKAYVTGFTAAYDFPMSDPVQPRQHWLTPLVLRSVDGGAAWTSVENGQLPYYGTRGVSVDPTNPSTLLVSRDRGVSRSADAGAHWEAMGAPWFNAFPSIARSPSEPATVYAAGGPGFVFKSTNGGANWEYVPSSGNFTDVSALGVDAAIPTRIYARDPYVLALYSADTSVIATWIRLLNNARDFLVDPASSGVVYAVMGVSNPSLYRSADFGSNWVVKNSRLPTPPLQDARLVKTVAAGALYLYSGDELLKSVDEGASWVVKKSFSEPILTVAQAPSNANVLYVGTGLGIYRSADGGETWSQRAAAAQTGLSSLTVDPANSEVLYAGFASQADAFVTVLNSTATGFVYSTYLGGGAYDSGLGIAVDQNGNAYVTGTTTSADFPTTPGASVPPYSVISSNKRVFLAKISSSSPGCSYSVKPAHFDRLFLDSGGGTTRFVVIAPSGCGWEATSGEPWIRVVQTPLWGARGAGTGWFSISVDANSGTSRQGSVTVGGQAVAVAQAGTGCSYALSNIAQPAAASGAMLLVSVQTGPGCLWGVDSPVGWVTAGAGWHTGPEAVELSVAANPAAVIRDARVIVAGQAFTVSQAGTGTAFNFSAPSVQAGYAADSSWRLNGVTVSPVPSGVNIISSQPWLSYCFGGSSNGELDCELSKNTTGRVRSAELLIGGAVLTVTQDAWPSKPGVYAAGRWQLDTDGDGVFDAGVDQSFTWGWLGTTPIQGDWNGDGKQKAGLFVDGLWYLDYDGNGVWDNGVIDKVYGFGMAGAQPVVGDWNGDGKDEIAIYINGFWFLDVNGNGVWDGEPTDKMIIWGFAGSTPVIGDWNGDGRKKVGLFYSGLWYLDYNGDGVWDGGTTDKVYGFGMSGVEPMVGDWNGDGKQEIGIYIGGFWFLDLNGNGLWDGEATDRMTILGWAGTTPVVGDWNGDGKAKMGTFVNGYWHLDYDGSGVWDGGSADKAYVFGQAGDAPVVGRW